MATRKRKNDDHALSPSLRAKRTKLNGPPVAIPSQAPQPQSKGFVALKHLTIRGVRSFPPNTSQTIVFEEPLTVLEGPNGVGKTTVTEALRYATTGAVPPGPGGLAARQHTFIHQPSGTILPWPSPSQAMVRLAFRNVRGELVTVTRKVTLTMRDNLTLQAKSQPVRLTIQPTDGGGKLKRTVPSKAVAAVMAEHFNVSAAILDSVLFVHQREADWPLTSAQELKDRIDKILETNIQTKALEEFGKYRKQCERDMSKLEVELAKWAEAVQSKQRTHLRLYEMERESNAAKQQLTTLHHEANALEIKVTQAQAQANEANVAPTMRPLLRSVEKVLQTYQSQPNECHVVYDNAVSFMTILKSKQEPFRINVSELSTQRHPLDMQFTTAQTEYTRAQKVATQAKARYDMLKEKVEGLKADFEGAEISIKDAEQDIDGKLIKLDDRIQRSYAEAAQRTQLNDASKRLGVLNAKLTAHQSQIGALTKTLKHLGSEVALDAQIKTTQAHIQTFHKTKARGTVARDAQVMLEKADSTCPVCVQPLEGSLRTALLRKYRSDVQQVPDDTQLQEHQRQIKVLRANRLKWLSTQQSLTQLHKTVQSATQERDAESKQVAALRERLQNVPSDDEIAALRATQAELRKQRIASRTFESTSKEVDALQTKYNTTQKTMETYRVALKHAHEALTLCDQKLAKVAQKTQAFRQLIQAEHDLQALQDCVVQLSTDDGEEIPILQSDALAPLPQIAAHQTARLQHYQTRYTSYAQDQTQASQLLRQSKEALGRVKQTYHEQRGRHEALAHQCNELQSQLEDEHYREADLNHARLTKQIATYTRAIDDMKRYHRARADAIVRYHQETMTEINRILDELWKQSYQGGDIETIRIVSERRKNTHIYDYRVVMQMTGASDVQTKDMRAYASRGQQVLACMMIRFAFARAFSLHTNLMVLDEPTTNLDSEHVRMLANTLKRIIAIHPKGTLQLVVITHNRAFVEQLCKSQHADYYYQLRRTPYTTVIKKPIRTL